jgi:putative restriction endonuclease
MVKKRMPRRGWTRSEQLQVLELYFRTPFGRLHRSNPELVEIAKRIGRTPSAVALKAVNFASCDERLKARGIRGMSNASEADRVLFEQFLNDPETHLAEISVDEREIEDATKAPCDDDFPMGYDVKVSATARRGHAFFRRSVYANFGGACAMSGLKVTQLLTASHIIPWKMDAKRRCDPRNGLLLSALHDRAFDRGFLTIDSELRIRASRAIRKTSGDEFCAVSLAALDGQPLRLPRRLKFLPSAEALDFHRKNIFQG